MRLISLGKLLGAGFLATVLAACGGGGSSSGCAPTNPNCNVGGSGPSGPTINALGVDGPLLSAAVDLFALQDYIDNGTGATSLLAAPTQSDAATGLINDMELVANPGTGPFVLTVTADGDTTDLTTGAAPVIGSVSTVITAAQYAQTPQPRFYATPLTSLVLSQAIANAATATEADVLAALPAAQADVKALFGFGIDPSIDLLTTPPVIDESTSGDAGLQGDVAEYRAAIETLSAVLAPLTTNDPADGDAILMDIAGDIEDGVYADDDANGVLAALETISAATPGDVLALLTQETNDLGLGVSLDGSVMLPGGFPTSPDSDQDGIPNDTDPSDTDVCLPSPFNANCTQDSDGDGETDFSEGETADSDGDGTADYLESSITDTDGDGLVDEDDSSNADACLPSAFNAACPQDTDGDGDTDFAEGETTDSDGDGTPDFQESSITDTDSDGLVDEDDSSNADACLPSAFNANCAQDTDGDGDTDFTETETADSDGDGTPDFQESSIADADSDGLSDEADPVNNDACLPSAFNASCPQDSDGDGESDFTETELADVDGDGTPDYLESSIVDSDGDGASDEVESSITDTDSDGLVDQNDIDNNDACVPSPFNANCAQDTDGDGDTDFTETETADGDGDGTPDYQESSILDADSDGVVDEDDPANNDACDPSPFNANCNQDSDGDGDTDFTETETADSDADGTPDYLESSILDADGDGTVDEDDPANNDGCIPDAMSPTCGVDNDGDTIDDATDTDDDNDSRLDTSDPDPLNSESIYHFDFFYSQLSSGGGDFKAATIGETVVQSDGSIGIGVNAAASTALDLGTNMTGPSGDGVGNFNVREDYQTVEESLLFSGAGFAAATGTPVSAASNTVSTDASTAVDMNDPTLDFTAESPTFSLATWGINNFIGAGRVALQGVGSTLATAAEQAISVLSFADGASDDADLNGTYGFIEINVTYSDVEADAISTLGTRIVDLDFDGSGGLTAGSGGRSEFVSSFGLSDGSITYENSALMATSYTVNPTGAVQLAIDGATNDAFADAAGDLVTVVVDSSGRAYGGKLGTGVTAADLIGKTFDLSGLVVNSASNAIEASNYVGATISFADAGGGNLTATLAGSVDQASADFDAMDAALPTVASASTSVATAASNTFTVDGSGRIGTITFASSGLEIEGYYTETGGLLLRLVHAVASTVGGGGDAGLNAGGNFYPLSGPVFNNVVPQVCSEADGDLPGGGGGGQCVLRDAAEGDQLAIVTGSGQILLGTWTEGSGGGGGSSVSTPFTSLATANPGAAQNAAAIDALTGGPFDNYSVTQGILFGVEQ